MKINVLHQTEYAYERPVHHSIHELRLIPKNSKNQSLLRWKVNVPSKVFESTDAFGNAMQSFVIDTNYSELVIESKGEIETCNEHVLVDEKRAVSPYYLLQQTPLTEPNEEMMAYFKKITPAIWTEDTLISLTKTIGEKIQYISGITDSKTLASEAFALEKGVCQDQAHLMISLCRFNGIPARYVSGYVFDVDQPAESSHAWLDVCLNIEHGEWLSIDVTNQCFINDCHIRLAVGRDYDHVAPVKGLRFGGGQESLTTHISINQR